MSQPGYVYLVHGRGTSYIKAGKTTRLFKRVQQLSQGVPFPIDILYAALVHDMDEEERLLKHRFQVFRSRGEWFEVPKDILAEWPVTAITFSDEFQEKMLSLRKNKRATRSSKQDRILDKVVRKGPLTLREIQQRTKLSKEDIGKILMIL